MANMKELIIPVLFMMGVSGCSTINPERSIASELVGQNVSEAVKRLAPSMGQPRYITPSSSNPEYTFYEWISNEGYYDVPRLAGTYTNSSGGQVQHVENWTKDRKYTACRVNMTVNSQGIIEYYETRGCGFMGMGNTGTLHKWGIN
ncbi:hypothetical protein PSCICN_20640 [Pseudomonas cichorii]|uniref:hypothetical protein n=1 Tax=Pseudomonas cichorii TaxID=36746 RepID=UPI001910B99B|nr:hypothetical protein [Pseudomonas cichorii]GFM81372.1 hypothetical protein PSCICN_20640 [Pseudomonas cichorii]